MPNYEFECRDCGHRFTVNVPWSKKEDVECPQCEGKDLREFYGFFLAGGAGAPREGGGCASFG